MMTARMKIGFLFASVLLGFVGFAQAGSFFKVGEPAPNFALTSLDGQKVSLDQYKGESRCPRAVSYLQTLFGTGHKFAKSL